MTTQLLDFLKALKGTKLDDLVDRFHYRLTTLLFTFFALLIGSKQTYGEPLACMLPSHFPETWNQYIHQFCYVSGTYHSGTGAIYNHNQPQQSLGYYQWVPYVLTVQAFCFYVPHVLWLSSLSFSTVDFKTVVDRCVDARAKSNADRKLVIEDVAETLYSANNLKRMGSRVTCCYLGAKLMNIVNVTVQLVWIHYFVGGGSLDWPLKIVSSAFRGEDWQSTGLFPRISFCDFNQNTLGSVQSRTVQCVLMINMLNEKAFVLIDVWLFGLLLVSVVNLLHSAYSLRFSGRFLVKRLAGKEGTQPPQSTQSVSDATKSEIKAAKPKIRRFDLTADCQLLLRFVADHAGKLTAAELREQLKLKFSEVKSSDSSAQPLDSSVHEVDDKRFHHSGHENQSYA